MTALSVGIALVVAAAIFALLHARLALRDADGGLETFLATWLSLLIVTLFLGAVAAVLGLIGVNRIKKGTPPMPEQAIREAKLTTEAIKS